MTQREREALFVREYADRFEMLCGQMRSYETVEAEAADIVQAAFVNMWVAVQSGKAFPLKGSFKHWMFCCVRHQATDTYRRGRTRRKHIIRSDDAMQGAQITDEEFIEEKQQDPRQAFLTAAIERIPHEGIRRTLRLRRQGVKIRHIAKQENVSMNTIAGRCSYGKLFLQKEAQKWNRQ